MAGGKAWRLNQLPVDFLINEEGIVVDLFRAQKIEEHMPLERIEAFVPPEKRYKCNGRQCIFPQCRQNYEEIQAETRATLHGAFACAVDDQ